MKLVVHFSETNQVLSANVQQEKGSFAPNLGELFVLHDGENGATFIPEVSPDGVISWTNNRDLPNPDPVNIKGAKGDKGADGTMTFEDLTEAQKASLVNDVLIILKNTAKAAKIGEVTLLASKWVGSNNLYSQVVSIEGVTEYSQVDITPSVEQLAVFYEKDIAFVTENEEGVVTVYVIGQKPTSDYTIQVTITEVEI